MKPRALKVGCKHYDVLWSKKAWHARVPSEGTVKDSLDMGRTDHANGTIWISPFMGKEEQQSTLLHEVMHCLYWNMGVELSTLWSADEDEFEERMVSVMEPRLLAFLVDNPHVVRYLTEK